MMADDKKTAAQTAEPTEATDATEVAEDTAVPAAAAPAPSAEEFATMRDQLLRTLAEMENLRQRTAREVADTRQYAVSNFAREILAVGDNLRRAIGAVPKELRHGDDKALVALVEGVEVTERGLEQTLAKFGVRPIEARGHKFDPSMHQAMLEVESDEVAPGSVAQEMQTGYVIGERVLRPSLVAVAKKAANPPAKRNGESGPGEPPEAKAADGEADKPADAASTEAAEAPSPDDRQG